MLGNGTVKKLQSLHPARNSNAFGRNSPLCMQFVRPSVCLRLSKPSSGTGFQNIFYFLCWDSILFFIEIPLQYVSHCSSTRLYRSSPSHPYRTPSSQILHARQAPRLLLHSSASVHFPISGHFLALLIRCKRDFFLFSATQAVVFFEPYSILATFQSIDIPEKATVCSSPLCLRGEFPSFVDFYSSLLMFFEEI